MFRRQSRIVALWGYNIVVVQPMAQQVAENTSPGDTPAPAPSGAAAGAGVKSPGDTADLYGTEAQGGDRAVGDTNVTNLVASGAVTAGTGLTVMSGGSTITAGQVDIGDWLNLAAQTAVVVGAGGTITPTGVYQLLTSAGVVTTSTSNAVADGAETGDVLILRNANAADAITVDGVGGNVECKTDKALGPGDTLMLIWNGADWNCLSLSDNS